MAVGAPWWDDKPVAIIGGGSSIRGFDFSRLAGIDAHVLGINWAAFDAPVTATFTADCNFIRTAYAKLVELPPHVEMFFAPGTPEPIPRGIIPLGRKLRGKLSDDPIEVHCTGSSGYSAINLAYLKRAKKIVLFGYDYDRVGAHYHTYEDHPVTYQAHWGLWAESYETMVPQLQEAGVTVLNANPNSVISVFPKISHDEALKELRNGVATGNACYSPPLRMEQVTP